MVLFIAFNKLLFYFLSFLLLIRRVPLQISLGVVRAKPLIYRVRVRGTRNKGYLYDFAFVSIHKIVFINSTIPTIFFLDG